MSTAKERSLNGAGPSTEELRQHARDLLNNRQEQLQSQIKSMLNEHQDRLQQAKESLPTEVDRGKDVNTTS